MTGVAAMKSAILARLEQASLIHLATHGDIDGWAHCYIYVTHITMRVRADIFGHARIKYVGKSQACMV